MARSKIEPVYVFVNGEERTENLSPAELNDIIIDIVMNNINPAFHWEDNILICE